jgi:hypothetical protein
MYKKDGDMERWEGSTVVMECPSDPLFAKARD